MQIQKTEFEGLWVIKPKVYEDKRGYFMESYNHQLWYKTLRTEFIQDNESMSGKGVLRGLHFQKPPYAQDKLVRVIRGSVLDVVVDLRKDKPTYGKHFKIVLSEQNKAQLFIPKGFAHGFLCLEEHTVFAYKCSQYYHAKSEGNLLWNDPDIGISWNIKKPIVSEKDENAPLFKDFNSPF